MSRRLLVTRISLAACVAVAGLVQTQRVSPAAFASPSTVGEALTEPWRIIGTLCYSDGLTLSFVLRLHVLACASYNVELACDQLPQAQASRSPIPLAGSALYATCLAIGVGLLVIAGRSHPAELSTPYHMGSVTLFVCYLACSLPDATRRQLGRLNVGVPFASWLPYAMVLVSTVLHGPSSSFPLFAGVGAGLLFEIADLLPYEVPAVKPGRHPEPDTTLSRRSGTTLALLALSLLSRAIGFEGAPPVLPAASLMQSHGAALYLSTALPQQPPAAVHEYFDALTGATNLSLPVTLLQEGAEGGEDGGGAAVRGSPAKPLNAAQLLKLYQHVADGWHAKLRDIRYPPSQGNLRARGGSSGKALPEISEAEASEMERLLSDALSRADFASSVSDRDVLKTILKGLTKTQAATMARMPRERLLSTIAAHRESHRVAHESLARLGHLLKELQIAELATLPADPADLDSLTADESAPPAESAAEPAAESAADGAEGEADSDAPTEAVEIAASGEARADGGSEEGAGKEGEGLEPLQPKRSLTSRLVSF